MAKQTGSTFLRRRLGAKLRRMREAAEYTLDAARQELDKTRSALQRIEAGETRADVHLVRTMMDLYDQYDPELLEEAREAYKKPWYRAYDIKDKGYVDVETEAAEVSEFSATILPGLLQTEAYTRALLGYWNQPPVATKNVLAVRRVRRERLTAEAWPPKATAKDQPPPTTTENRPLRLTAVVDAMALSRPIGGRSVMREQLVHLAAAASLPTVTLRVLPVERSAPAAGVGAFILLAFPHPEDPMLLYTEGMAGAAHIEDPEEVREAKLVFDRLQTEALTPADSVALIERMAGELDDQ